MTKTLKFIVQPALSVWLKNQLKPFAKTIDISFLHPGIHATLILNGVAEADIPKIEEIKNKINPSDPIDYEHCDQM